MKTGKPVLRIILIVVSVLAAIVILSALARLALRMNGEADPNVGQIRILGSVVTIEHVLTVRLPEPAEQWEAVTGARLDDYSPRPVLALFHQEPAARVLLQLWPAEGVTPENISTELAKQLTDQGFEVAAFCGIGPSGRRCSLVFESISQESAPRGKIWIEYLPGDPQMLLIIISTYAPTDYEQFEPQIDYLADHVRSDD
ncbi:MAG: hypothetical protein WCT10_03135 [Patescibacteria group bacterium]|jgi:hypothetical protein